MNRVLEDRVLGAHPLTLAHRMVLFFIARDVPEGQTEALVNKSAVARRLDAPVQAVTHALSAGAEIGLCRVLRNGRIAFNGYDGMLGAEKTAPMPSGVTDAPPHDPGEVVAKPTSKELQTVWKQVWEPVYRQEYYIQNTEWRLFRDLASRGMSVTELRRRASIYVANNDSYYTDCKHAFSVFYRFINRFIPTSGNGERSRVLDADQTRERYLSHLTKAR